MPLFRFPAIRKYAAQRIGHITAQRLGAHHGDRCVKAGLRKHLPHRQAQRLGFGVAASDCRERDHRMGLQLEGEVVRGYLQPKELLDTIRHICRGKDKPIEKLYRRFNEETEDGRNMSNISKLLNEAINSIIENKEESDIDSLFKTGGTSALLSQISGLENFELICFLVVK